MKTIWKYPIRLTDQQTIQMPSRAHILYVQLQDGAPCLWAHVDPESKSEARKIIIVGTGRPAPAATSDYVGTFQDGPFVWHVFEGH